ncbi:MAG TPA: TIR domain-containing protein, partial [Chloroflexota bacterium]
MAPHADGAHDPSEAAQPRPFAELVRRYRGAAGLTQEELAERAGLSSRGVSLLERGGRQPYRDTVRRLADAFVLIGDERERFVAVGRGLPRDGQAARAPEALFSPDDRHIAADSWIYVAYAQDDQPVVARLHTDLRRRGITTWVDEHDLPPGTPSWEQALRDAIRAAAALLLIASPRTRASRYIADELRIAELYRRRVYPIWIDGEEWIECVPLGWGGLQYLDARGARYDTAITSLVAAVSKMRDLPIPAHADTPEPAASTGEPRNPYKGLRPFTGADAGDFFGRDDLIDELLTTLRAAAPTAPRFLALVGASGSGKSSVLLAGLLPRLQAGALPGSEGWIYLAPMAPGMRPLDMLALATQPIFPGSSPEAIRSLLDQSPEVLHRRAAEAITTVGQRVVLVVDQCEELFSPLVDEQERRRCIEALVAAATAPGGAILLLLTLRADFYDRPLRYPALGALLHTHNVVLPPNEEDLRRAIEGPAALPDVAITFDEDLVGDLLFDLRGQAGALPLLQFTLDQLFTRRRDWRLTGAAYRALGGVRGALARHAEATYSALADDEQRRLARALFLRLIDPGQTEQDTTRRRAAMTELVLPDPARTERLHAVVDAFITARLLVATGSHAGAKGHADTTVEVSHEALIREWSRLGAWLHEARDDIRRQQTISADAAAWERHDRSADHLYRGTLLIDAEGWAGRNTPSAREAAFLAAAQAEQERQHEDERDRQARQLALTQQALAANQNAARRLRALVGVLALFLAVAAVLSVIAVRGTLQARDAQQRAEAAAHAVGIARSTLNEHDLALSAGLATQAGRLLTTHYDLSLLLSVQAARTADTLTTRSTLLSALLARTQLKTLLHGQNGGVRALAYSPDGRILASGGDDDAIRLWDAASEQQIGPPLTGHTGAVTTLAFSSDGTLLASGSADQTIRLWHRSGAGGRWVPLGVPLGGQRDQVRVAAFSPNGKLLAASSWDGSIWLWDLSGPRPRGAPLTTFAGDLGALAFSPDGKTLAAGGQDVTTIQLWDVAHRRPLGAPIAGQKGYVEQLAFSPDGRLLASTGNNGTLRVWDVHGSRLLGAPLAIGINPTSSPAFSRDGKLLALASGAQTLLWDVSTRRPVGAPISAHDGDVYSVAFSPDGATLATGDANHAVELWDLSSVIAGQGSPLATVLANPDPVTILALSPSGAILATGDLAGRVRLWDVPHDRAIGVLSVAGGGSIIALAFSPDGKLLAGAVGGGSIQLWDMARRRALGPP